MHCRVHREVPRGRCDTRPPSGKPGNGPFLVQESERRVRISGEPPVARSCRHQWHGTPRQWSWRFFLPTHTMTNSASRIVMVANRMVMCHPLCVDSPAGGVGGHQGQHGSAMSRPARSLPAVSCASYRDDARVPDWKRRHPVAAFRVVALSFVILPAVVFGFAFGWVWGIVWLFVAVFFVSATTKWGRR